MLQITSSRFPVPRKLYLFAEQPSLTSGLFASYRQSFCTHSCIGFKRHPFFTKTVDISTPDFDVDFSKNARYGIRKAKAAGVFAKTITDYDLFASFYNRFTVEKKLDSFLASKTLKKYADNLVLRAACLETQQVLVVHSYICDRSSAIVRAFHSASSIHDPKLDTKERTVIGWANVFLHYADMQFFREQGFATYDLGGYAVGPGHESLVGVNKFKDNFGGTLVEQSHFDPYWVYMLKAARDHIQGIRQRLLRKH